MQRTIFATAIRAKIEVKNITHYSWGRHYFIASVFLATLQIFSDNVSTGNSYSWLEADMTNKLNFRRAVKELIDVGL